MKISETTRVWQSEYNMINPFPLDAIKWTGGFWGERLDQCEKVMLPSMDKALHSKENGANLDNFIVAADKKSDRFIGTYWSDGDCYKYIESCAYIYAVSKDKSLDILMDVYIDAISRAQDEDGYICTQVQLGKGWARWKDRMYHELYNMGHLMTAASVHYRATGKQNFLNVAIKLADYLVKKFNPTPKELMHYCWNPSNIMGLVDLYRVTRSNDYIELAEIFVRNRGKVLGGDDQNQTRTELVNEDEAVGHAVTALYLYCGAVDVYAETGKKELLEAVQRIWGNIVKSKMYVTGAVGAYYSGLSSHDDKVSEAFGREYELPNFRAYNETCANIANAMLNFRLLNQSGDSKYADIMELVIYNSLLSAMSLDGTKFFYANPLSRYRVGTTDDKREMKSVYVNDTADRWFTHVCYCCPPSAVRAVARMGEWAYGLGDDKVWIHLYGNNTLKYQDNNGDLFDIEQNSNYPWDGNIRIVVRAIPNRVTSIMVRIPKWSKNNAILVNGEPITEVIKNGEYHQIDRVWGKDDIIEISLDMQERLIQAHPLVEQNRGQVAVMRGPIVYCFESVDLPHGVKATDVYLPKNVEFQVLYNKSKLNGIVELSCKAVQKKNPYDNELYMEYSSDDGDLFDLRMIPYYGWSNRGSDAEMQVWIPIR